MGTVIEMVVLVHQTHSLGPIERFLGPLSISVVAGIQGQTGTQIEETTVGDRILVVVSSIESEDLPPQAATAVLSVPPASLIVENSLCQRQPLGLVRWRIWEFLLRG